VGLQIEGVLWIGWLSIYQIAVGAKSAALKRIAAETLDFI
jgi:hypothetical protein